MSENTNSGGNNFVRDSLIGFVIAGAIFGALVVGRVIPMGGGEEDDRPPIIIANGSVDIFSMDDTKDGDRGKWVKDSDTNWHHEHGAKNGPSQFTVTPIGSDDAGCTTPTKNVKTVLVTYTYTDGTAATVRLTGDGTYVRGVFQKLPTQKTDYWLTLDAGSAGIQSVQLDGNTPCKFVRNPIIEIRPRK